jgi:hypothetical protein
MPADELAWLIDRFPRFNTGDDPVFTARYLKRLRVEADLRGFPASELLEMIEDYRAAALGWSLEEEPVDEPTPVG